VLPGGVPIRHEPYGTGWDSKTPMVLTGHRPNWPAHDWGWRFWADHYGSSMVVGKSRAPIFDSDTASETLMAECTLREFIDYARSSGVSPKEAAALPSMYMNGWDVFEEHNELWQPHINELPGTIDNRSRAEYKKLNKQYQIKDEGQIESRVRQLCKLFVSPVGAITRMHYDNHSAHAWLCNLRGYKLYVLASPEDSDKVQPRGAAAQDGGHTAEARLDPLDLDALLEDKHLRVTLYVTILAPGQTILAPDGWWHYAASLTPTITLMCNFWDSVNVRGLHDQFTDHVARVLDKARRETAMKGEGPSLPQTSASTASTLIEFAEPQRCIVIHQPFVYIRDSPSTAGSMLKSVRYGQQVLVDASRDGWLRLATPVTNLKREEKGAVGWVLEDGKALGLGKLIERISPEVLAELSKRQAAAKRQ